MKPKPTESYHIKFELVHSWPTWFMIALGEVEEGFLRQLAQQLTQGTLLGLILLIPVTPEGERIQELQSLVMGIGAGEVGDPLNTAVKKAKDLYNGADFRILLYIK